MEKVLNKINEHIFDFLETVLNDNDNFQIISINYEEFSPNYNTYKINVNFQNSDLIVLRYQFNYTNSENNNKRLYYFIKDIDLEELVFENELLIEEDINK
jgi:hypothetical protein